MFAAFFLCINILSISMVPKKVLGVEVQAHFKTRHNSPVWWSIIVQRNKQSLWRRISHVFLRLDPNTTRKLHDSYIQLGKAQKQHMIAIKEQHCIKEWLVVFAVNIHKSEKCAYHTHLVVSCQPGSSLNCLRA
jgi:hypothetical protein